MLLFLWLLLLLLLLQLLLLLLSRCIWIHWSVLAWSFVTIVMAFSMERLDVEITLWGVKFVLQWNAYCEVAIQIFVLFSCTLWHYQIEVCVTMCQRDNFIAVLVILEEVNGHVCVYMSRCMWLTACVYICIYIYIYTVSCIWLFESAVVI